MKNASTHAKLLAVAFIWGLGWVAGRVVARDIPPSQRVGQGIYSQ